MVVVLPAPLCPRNAVISPSYMFRFSSSTDVLVCPGNTYNMHLTSTRDQWRSQRGGLGSSTPHSHRRRFFHSRKVTVIKYYNLSLTTRRTINSHNLRKTNHLGGAIASMVECVLNWIREQYLVVCNIAK